LIFLKDVLGNIDSVFAGGNIAILPPHYHFITLCHPEWSVSGIRHCVPSVRRNNKEQITQPSSVSRADTFPLYYGGRQVVLLCRSLGGILRHVAKATAQDDKWGGISERSYIVIPKLAEKSCDFSRIQTLFYLIQQLPLAKISPFRYRSSKALKCLSGRRKNLIYKNQ
jgi:hypothetical protein